MKRTFAIVAVLVVGIVVTLGGGTLRAAPPAAEKPAKTPACRVAVDPRVELMCVIFRLAGNREYNRSSLRGYVDDVTKQFGPFRDHAVVKLAQKLHGTRGISYDAPMSMAVLLPDPGEMKDEAFLTPRPKTLDGRWTSDDAREFVAAARQFVKDASFQEFLDKHRELYKQTESQLQTLLDKETHLEWFNTFFGDRPGAAFMVVPALLNGPCNYGSSRRTADGREELYCILGVWYSDKQGTPRFTNDQVSTIVHEFCHSYANPIIDRHAAELQAAGEKIFPAVARRMNAMAYGNWKTMFYESLVRACVLRYTRHHDGATAAWMATQRERANGFAWMGGLSDLLGEYETHRDKYPTLEAFAPRLVAFFDDYAKKPVARPPKVVSMTPANGATGVDPSLKTIQVVFDRPMINSWSMCGGGPHFPEIVGKPAYDAKRTTWTVHVKLKPEWEYHFALNAASYSGFQSAEGVPLESVEVTFKTAKTKSDAEKNDDQR
ncbi:MAG: DUF4932 domain-containing protein [Thermoguttaceae bacterium]